MKIQVRQGFLKIIFLMFWATVSQLLGSDMPIAYVCSSECAKLGAVNVNEAYSDLTAEAAPIPIGSESISMVLSADELTAYVCNPSKNVISIVDLFSKKVRTVAVGVKPVAITLTPDETKACVVNLGSDTISIIDLATFLVKTVPVANASKGIAITPDSSTAFVSSNAGIVSIIDLKTFSCSMVEVYGLCESIAITPDGKMACVCCYETGLVIIDVATHIVRKIFIKAPLLNLCITPDSTRACMGSEKALYIVDIYSGAVTTVETPAQYLCMSPKGTKVGLCDSISGFVRTVDLETLQIRSLMAGRDNRAIAFTPDGSKICVVDYEDWSMYVMEESLFPLKTVFVDCDPVALVIARNPPNPTKPEPPLKFKGKIVRKKHKKTVLLSHWLPSPSKNIDYYEIFAREQKIAEIPGFKVLKFQKVLRSSFLAKKRLPKAFYKRIHKKFRIRAVNRSGLVSSFKSLQV